MSEPGDGLESNVETLTAVKHMSARMEIERLNWETLEPLSSRMGGKHQSEIQIECLFRNLDQSHLVASLREVQATLTHPGAPTEGAEAKCRQALALQEQWDACLFRRESLRAEIKRGREYLEQTQRELAGLRSCLEDWQAYERVCGQNPLGDYMQSLTAKERIEQFLPGWIQRRETELQSLNREISLCAKQNGMEHLV
jgi:hypothetical protein